MPEPVAAVPFELLAVGHRTAATDRALRTAATVLDGALAGAGHPPAGQRLAAHAGRARRLAAGAAATGSALLLAGGPPGLLALALWSSGAARRVPAAVAAPLLAAALGLDPRPGSRVERPAVDPVAVDALAAALGSARLADLAASHPHLVGPVDGMPIGLRYTANNRLAAEAGDPAVRALAGRQLLYVDPARGHAAEVLGDLTGAAHIAVVVPGMGNSIARFDRVAGKASALRDAAAALDPPSEIVTVAWLGYDSPTADVVLDDAARAGGPHLARFVAGLAPGGAPAAATTTVVGHSYGTLVTGFALRAGLAADAVAVTGSPGMGAARARDLGTVPVYALTAAWDFVSAAEHFGPDPGDPGFGATRLDTGRAALHGSYFDRGSESLRNLALVASGRAAEATRLDPNAYDRVVEQVDEGHRIVVESTVDGYQRAAGELARTLGGACDALEAELPERGARAVDGAQDAAGAAFEVGTRAIDFVQRLTSPDLAGGAVGDAWDLLT